MNRRTTRCLAVTTTVACAIGLLGACSGSSKKAVATSTAPSSSASPTPTPTPTPTKTVVKVPPAVNYLTGVGAPSTRPVIAVKVDDTESGRPQLNIDKADIVYIEQAEGGLSRLVGVFGTNYPVVGYVRSARTSDPELLQQFGRITLAASGGGGDSLSTLDASGLTPWINDRGAGFFARAPHNSDHGYVNLTLNLSLVASTVKSPAARKMGFVWSSALGRTLVSGAGTRIVTRVGSTTVEFRWVAALNKYQRYIDGVPQYAADGAPIATPTVVVQACVITPHYGDVDVNGNPAQFTNTIGRGLAVVFRNGRRINGTWTRPAAGTGTTLLDAHRQVIPLAPGGAWVALVGTGTPVSVS